MLFLLDGPDYAQVVEDFEANHDPSSYSTVHHEEGHSLQVTFQRDFLSWTTFRFQYLITSSGTTCSLSPINRTAGCTAIPFTALASRCQHGLLLSLRKPHRNPYSVRPRRAKSFSEYVIIKNGDISGIPNYKIMVLNEWKL